TEIEQDIGGLPDHEFARLQERRRERRGAFSWFQHLAHRIRAVALARHVGVAGAGLLQRQTHIFAAALNGRPVIELIVHRRRLQSSGNLPAAIRRYDMLNKSFRRWFVTPARAKHGTSPLTVPHRCLATDTSSSAT